MLAKGFTRRIFGPVYHAWRLNEPGVFSLYRRYKAVNRLNRDELLEIQNNKIKAILVHARDNTEFYRKIFHDYSFDPEKYESQEQLEVLPVLRKNTIRENMNSMLDQNMPAEERHIAVTGGTSGVRMRFYRSNDCRSHRVALQWRSDNWAGWNPHDNLAYIWPVFSDFEYTEGKKTELVSNYITGVESHYAGRLNHAEVEEIVNCLIRFRPKIIRCFPTPAKIIAEYLHENNLTIPGLRSIISTGEPLYQADREILETGFNAEVYNLYASREVGTTACECSEHWDLHVATDSVHVEVTRNGRLLPVGEYGEILITDLYNTAMPLIRYAIGDYGQLTGDFCPCGMGYPLMKNIAGRIGDLFYDIDGNPIMSQSVQLHLIDNGPDVGQVQLIQKSAKRILVRVTDDPAPDDSMKKFYIRTLKGMLKGLEEVDFDIVNRIESEKSGKYRLTICEIDKDEIARLKRLGRSNN